MLDLSFIDDKQNLIMYGVCKSGKTMLSICLGKKAESQVPDSLPAGHEAPGCRF
jgi:DNA replication protein DnaC